METATPRKTNLTANVGSFLPVMYLYCQYGESNGATCMLLSNFLFAWHFTRSLLCLLGCCVEREALNGERSRGRVVGGAWGSLARHRNGRLCPRRAALKIKLKPTN